VNGLTGPLQNDEFYIENLDMKSKNALRGLAMAVVLQLGVLAGSAQTNIYLFSGTTTNITLPPGTYIITAYGAPGGPVASAAEYSLGAEMSAEFNFSTSTPLTLLVGGGGGVGSYVDGDGGGYNGYDGSYDGGGGGYGGGGGGFITGGGGGGPGVGIYGGGGAGGGGGGYSGGGNDGSGGSIIDSSAIAILTEVSGTYSPYYTNNGEIIITAVPTPLLITTNAAFGFTNGMFGFNMIGPSGTNVVIQAGTDLQTWIPLQTNLLGSGPLYFSDPQSPASVQRFYRSQLSP
jgi:hypothetical protein